MPNELVQPHAFSKLKSEPTPVSESNGTMPSFYGIKLDFRIRQAAAALLNGYEGPSVNLSPTPRLSLPSWLHPSTSRHRPSRSSSRTVPNPHSPLFLYQLPFSLPLTSTNLARRESSSPNGLQRPVLPCFQLSLPSLAAALRTTIDPSAHMEEDVDHRLQITTAQVARRSDSSNAHPP